MGASSSSYRLISHNLLGNLFLWNILYHNFMNISTVFMAFHDIYDNFGIEGFLRCLIYYSSVSFCTSIVSLAPRRNAYSKMAASARLIYSLQQSWNFSKVSFCSSVKLFSSSSWCLAMYPRSSFICGELVLLSSCGTMFPCHSSFIIFFIGCASFSVSTTTYHRRERKSSTFSKINPTFSPGVFFAFCDAIFA